MEYTINKTKRNVIILASSILILYVLTSSLFFLFDSIWTKAIFITTNAIWIIATIFLIVFLFQIKMKDYPGILSIRKYAISIILFFVLVTTIPLFGNPVNSFTTRQLVELTFAIPYIFTIDFAIKLYSKK